MPQPMRDREEEMLLALEGERAKSARSLRAETVQVLATVLIGLSSVEHLDNIEAIRDALRDLRESVREDLDQVQRRASEIRPSVLDDFGLAAAVRATADSLQGSGGASVQIEWSDETLRRLQPEQEVLLFRIVQEALRNAIRHADARQISIRMRRDAQELLIEVHDDGRGFAHDRTDLGAPVGYGLRLLQAHARVLGGNLELESRPGGGTTVRLHLPLEGDA